MAIRGSFSAQDMFWNQRKQAYQASKHMCKDKHLHADWQGKEGVTILFFCLLLHIPLIPLEEATANYER
jgi:hypothetical protein